MGSLTFSWVSEVEPTLKMFLNMVLFIFTLRICGRQNLDIIFLTDYIRKPNFAGV